MKRFFVWFVLFTFLGTISCQSYTFGPPRAANNYKNGAQMMPKNQGEFETTSFEEKDKVGMWVFVGIAAAAGVASAILLPMYLSDKL